MFSKVFTIIWFFNYFLPLNYLNNNSLNQENKKIFIKKTFKTIYSYKKIAQLELSFFYILKYIISSNFNFYSLLFLYIFKKFNYLNLIFKNIDTVTYLNFKSYSKTATIKNIFFYSLNSLKVINDIKLKYNPLNYINKFFLTKSSWDLNLKNYKYVIKYSVTDFFKYLNNFSLAKINILFLRKNKVFNKGRYSRNRQYYRTGVYWCLYVNIIAVIGIYFWFYRFNINFGYLWWILYFFFFSIFFSRSYSLNVFGVKNTFFQIFNSYVWFFSILYNTFLNIFFFFKK